MSVEALSSADHSVTPQKDFHAFAVINIYLFDFNLPDINYG